VIFSNRILLVALIASVGTGSGVCGQEKLTIPPTPTEREFKSKEQIRRDLAVLCEKARTDAVSILKRTQWSNGAWIADSYWQTDEVSPLVIEALLDHDVLASDPVIVKGLKNLRSNAPGSTDAVALQAVVLCKVNDKKDRHRIERNMAWLLETVKRDGTQFLGWGRNKEYRQPDDAYAFYAVMALRSAKLAGINVDRKVWDEIRDHYLERQKEDGSWTWVTQRGPTPSRSPTVMALYGLLACDDAIGSSTGRSANAIQKGIDRLVESLHFTDAEGTTLLYALSRLAQLSPNVVFASAAKRPRDWFEDGVVWIINNQQPSGSIRTVSYNSAKATASALHFLAAGK
jgi:hypothetical protein